MRSTTGFQRANSSAMCCRAESAVKKGSASKPDAVRTFSNSGVSTAFFFEPVGPGPLAASYSEGRDLTVPAGAFSRSLSNPLSIIAR